MAEEPSEDNERYTKCRLSVFVSTSGLRTKAHQATPVVDSGAQKTVVSRTWLARHTDLAGLSHIPSRCNLVDASHRSMSGPEAVRLRVQVGKRMWSHECIITDAGDNLLLGADFQHKANITIHTRTSASPTGPPVSDSC